MSRDIMESDIAVKKQSTKSTAGHNSATCDMSQSAKCRFPHCGPAAGHPILDIACFQIGKRQVELWPPEIGANLIDPCALDSIAKLRGGMVYAIGAKAAGPLKIGSASNVTARRDDLQTGNPRPLMILGARYCGARKAATAAENWLHHRFDGRRLSSGNGREWFDVCLAEFEDAARVYFYG